MADLPPILALDLATRTGWAELSPAGAVGSGWVQLIPDGQSDASRRLVALECWLWPRLLQLTRGPAGQRAVVVYEAPALVRGRAAPFRVGCHLEGAVLSMAQACGVPSDQILVVPAPEWKRHVAGSGTANKAAVLELMRARWARPDLVDDNESDALALLAWAIDQVRPGETQVLVPTEWAAQAAEVLT